MSVIKQVEALGKNNTSKTVTFSNTGAGIVNVFTVTGDVLLSIIPVITTSVASAAGANIRMGSVFDNDAMIVDTLASAMVSREIWLDATPDSQIESFTGIKRYIITDGDDVILTLDAQVDTGVIVFYCFWTPLSATGNVVAA